MRIRAVCYDLDDTLIREVHSVMLPCLLNSKGREHTVIQQREEAGELDYAAADALRAGLMAGLDENEIPEGFLRLARPLRNIAETVAALHAHGIRSLVVTVGPAQVARAVAAWWGMDRFYGSDYEVFDGKFTGKITRYRRAEDKVECLRDFCRRYGIAAEECAAVGDGATDIPVFRYCGLSIALNAAVKAAQAATYAVATDDLADILPLLVE